MELWIRSQHKDLLIRADGIWCESPYLIMARSGMKDSVIGYYGTKERCMEVINEIHKILQPKLIMKTPPLENIDSIDEFAKNYVAIKTEQRDYELIKEMNTVVYQMPEE